MSEYLNVIQNKKFENTIDETQDKSELSKFNDYINSQKNILTTLNIDKDSLFKSFILFQKFLTMNQNLNLSLNSKTNNKDNLVSKSTQIEPENNINENMSHSLIKINLKEETENSNFYKNIISLKNYNNNIINPYKKKNTINTKEISDAEKNEESKKIYVNKSKFDEIPIKPSGYNNFMELVEKTLAKEKRNNSKKIPRENSNPNLTKSRIYIEKCHIERNHPGKSTKSTRIKNKNAKDKINSIFSPQELNINAFNINNKNKKIYDNEISSIKMENEKNYINEEINEKDDVNIQFKPNVNNEQINEKIKNGNIKNNKNNKNNKISINYIEQTNNFSIIQNFNKNNNNEISIINKETISEFTSNNNDNNSITINRDHVIQQKIKELNSEIIKFKEERNKIYKLKLEYEKLQTKLINDVKQFTLRKDEFEKYRQEELNKIKNDKKKILTENKSISSIKFQNQSYAMTIKKDKETIKNLKEQIAEYQFLLKQKENEKRRSIKNNKKTLELKKLNELELDNFATASPFIDNKNFYETKFKMSERNLNRNKSERIMRNYSSTTGKLNRNYDEDMNNNQNQILENSSNGVDINKKEINNNINSNSDANYMVINKENLDNNSFDSLNKNTIEIKNDNNVFFNSYYLQNQFQHSTENYNNMANNKENAIDNNKIDNQNLNKKTLENDRGNNSKKRSFKNNQNSLNNQNKTNQKKSISKNKTETKLNNKGKNNGKLYNNNTNEQSNSNKPININKKNSKPKKNTSMPTLSSKNISIKKGSTQNQKNIPENDNYDFIVPRKYTDINYKLIKSLTSDGKIINLYTNNKREIIFESGIRKEIFDDGYYIVYFINGDLKQNFPDGKNVYFFNESKTIQTTFSDGLQVFKFNNDQIEKHYPNGTKQIIFPNGTVRYILNDGSEETYYADGTVQKYNNEDVENEKDNIENFDNNINNINNDCEDMILSERVNLQNNMKSIESNDNVNIIDNNEN